MYDTQTQVIIPPLTPLLRLLRPRFVGIRGQSSYDYAMQYHEHTPPPLLFR